MKRKAQTTESIEDKEFSDVLAHLPASLDDIVDVFIANELKLQSAKQIKVVKTALVNFLHKNLELIQVELKRVATDENYQIWLHNLQDRNKFIDYIFRMLNDNRLWVKVAQEQHFDVKDIHHAKDEVLRHFAGH